MQITQNLYIRTYVSFHFEGIFREGYQKQNDADSNNARINLNKTYVFPKVKGTVVSRYPDVRITGYVCILPFLVGLSVRRIERGR